MARRQVVSRDMEVRIDGLKEFRKALKDLSERYPDAVKQENILLANRLRNKAQNRARRIGGTVAKGSRSMKVTQNAKFAAIVGGTSGSRSDREVFFGAEFGSKRMTRGKKIPVNSRGPAKQKFGFKPWRGNQFRGWSGGPGYFLHPTIRDDGPEALRDYMERLARIERLAFPD